MTGKTISPNNESGTQKLPTDEKVCETLPASDVQHQISAELPVSDGNLPTGTVRMIRPTSFWSG